MTDNDDLIVQLDRAARYEDHGHGTSLFAKAAEVLRAANERETALRIIADKGPWPMFCPNCAAAFHEDGTFTPPTPRAEQAGNDHP